MAPLLTVRDVLARSMDHLKSLAMPTARLDAELLLGKAVGMDRLQLYLNMDRPLSDEEIDQARGFLRRRSAREPVAYILGYREFYSRRFAVGPGVLIPRPETEFLVTAVLELIRKRFAETERVEVLEFGIGSGAIAVSLAAELDRVWVTATEISESAVQVATENAATHSVVDRVRIVSQPNLDRLDGPYAAIVSNPPYIDAATRASLASDILDFEPHEALFADQNGLAHYRYLLSNVAARLVTDGFLAVEIGFDQEAAVGAIASEYGWRALPTVRDYAGHPRVMVFVVGG